MEYKIGDKVRVREDLKVNEVYGTLEFVSDMAVFRGKEVTIIKEQNGEYAIEGLEYCWFTEEMLEPIVDDTVKSIIDNYKEDELSFNFTISKYPTNSLESRRNTLIILFRELMDKDREMDTNWVSDANIWSINNLIDTMKNELELFKRRIYNEKI